MTWTTRKPDRPGYWWHRGRRNHCQIFRIIEGWDGRLWAFGTGDGGGFVDEIPGEWGDEPIPEPADAPGGET
jgi:hypothetical protein